MINTSIGKYKITRLIGEGGMASVYEAVHEMLGTKVAIKVLNPILSSNAQIRERFKNEAKVMATLNHPNITRVIDFDEKPDQLCIVMEYLEGEDLSQKIKNTGPLNDKQINQVFSQTLSACQYAHEKGVVHRDIKPSNIFILPDGKVKILDFGIAKLFGQSNEMTQTGTQMGTPTYMSPEQVRADKTIDHRSDIYSLGVTLYYAVNGKSPYNSTTESQFDIFNKIVYEPIPDITVNSKYNGIIKKACAKNREERYQNCNAWISEMNNPQAANSSPAFNEDKTAFEKNDDKTIFENKEEISHINEQVKNTSSINAQKPSTESARDQKVKTPTINLFKALCLISIVDVLISLRFHFQYYYYFYLNADYYNEPFYEVFYNFPCFLISLICNITLFISLILLFKLKKYSLKIYLVCTILIVVFSTINIFFPSTGLVKINNPIVTAFLNVFALMEHSYYWLIFSITFIILTKSALSYFFIKNKQLLVN
jgi:serine/threonine protein kinase